MSYSSNWYTPPEWLNWVEQTLGEGYFDPCPMDWDPTQESGLLIPWGPRVYVNHPGGRGQAKKWWKKLENENPERVIWCIFNMEQLRHLPILYTPGWLVLPNKRIGYIWGGPTSGKRVHRQRMKSPTHWSGFWSNSLTANPPEACTILETGRVTAYDPNWFLLNI